MPSLRFLSLLLFVVALLGYLLCGCNGMIIGGSTAYKIGRDDTWHPLNLMGKGRYLVAFSDDLLEAIGEEEDLRFLIATVDSSRLEKDLESGFYDGILSPMKPTSRLRSKFLFSDPYFLLGPVFVVHEDSEYTCLDDLRYGQVGVLEKTSLVLNAQIDSSIVVRVFSNELQALDSLSREEIDAVLLNIFPAYIASAGAYKGQFKIIGSPLTDEGIRLVAKKGDGEKLIAHFNAGLKVVREKSTYKTLIKKWGLVDPFP